MRPLSLLLALLFLFLPACSGGSTTAHETGEDGGHDAHPADVSTHDAGHDAPRDVAPPNDVYVPNRMAGDRTPLSAPCDPVDPTRCLLPWPSNTFTVKDSTTETGLRVHVTQQGIATVDSASSIDRADGFSRVSPIETAFTGTIDTTTLGELTTGAVRLLVEQPGSTLGQAVPLRFDVVTSTDSSTNVVTSLLIAYPRVPLAPNTDYAVVVMNSAHLSDGTPLSADRLGQVALGIATPETAAEGALYAYDAPARAAMKAAGVDPMKAVRVWDFTTRSLTQPTTDLEALRAVELGAFNAGVTVVASDAGAPDGATGPGDAGVGLAIDSVDTTVTGTLQMAVLGRVTGVPSFLLPSGALSRDDAGALVQVGVHDVPFRVAVPVGTGDYRIVMYGHGTGGTYDGTQFIGWTSEAILNTFGLFTSILIGTDIATSGLSQSLADTAVVQLALTGELGTLLAADTIAGVANPASGRRPNPMLPIWAGGSLGGTMGFVYSTAEPTITAAVLNVPGAAWAQFSYYSELFGYVKLIMAANYPDPIAIAMGVAESQLNFDAIDGAAWYDALGATHPLLLEQESIGDPVLPNIGNDMVATASHADQVGVVLNPIVTCTDVPEVSAHNGMTQFKVPSSVTDDLQIHGFAAGSTPAGIAAQQQIVAFITSVWAGSPMITVPPECVSNTPVNSCDFTSSP
jgi:hypothetical protein